MKTFVKIKALLKRPLSLETQRYKMFWASHQHRVILARTYVVLRTPSPQIFIWAVNTFLNTHHVVSKNKRYFKKRTSAQVVGTSGSQKSCMVCFYGATSQGTFKLGQLQTSICDDTWLKKKIGSRLKTERTLEMGRELNNIIYYLVLCKEWWRTFLL